MLARADLMLTPALVERLGEIARAARMAPHGQKAPIYAAACAELNLSHATLQRHLAKVAHRDERKRRDDAGTTALTRAEAVMIAAYLRAHTRNTGKRLASLEKAVAILRANREIAATRVDKASGEIVPLSISAIARGLQVHGLDLDTLSAPAPAVEMAAKHPNHVWMLDASLCVLYYLPKGGLAVMDAAVFEKNKPGNFKKVENERVWRYSVVDKCTGAIYLEYVFGGESGSNVASIFLNSLQQRESYPFYGVPWMMYVDPGCANTSAVFKNLCKGLQIDLRWHLPGNARATGAVEKSHDIIERDFEGSLALRPVNSLDELNAAATRWMHNYNATARHSRHGMTRYGAWSRIREEQLRIAPPLDICRELARTAPIERKVNDFLRVSWAGHEYDLTPVPGICNGQKVLVCRNPWREDSAQIVMRGENGHDVFHIVERVMRDEWGYSTDANVFGEDFKRHAVTPAQAASKEVDTLIAGSSETQTKGRKTVPFDGRIDPYISLSDSLPTYLPKRGTQLNVPTPVQIETRSYSHIEAMRWAVGRIGRGLEPEENALVRETWPDGVPEAELETMLTLLQGREEIRPVAAAGGLRLV
ncbi:MAG: integrase [Betaproteobacteria bacterium]|nr:integrase [Betaproteobacteria bacterium]